MTEHARKRKNNSLPGTAFHPEPCNQEIPVREDAGDPVDSVFQVVTLTKGYLYQNICGGPFHYVRKKMPALLPAKTQNEPGPAPGVTLFLGYSHRGLSHCHPGQSF
jgi:hypothetical protein